MMNLVQVVLSMGNALRLIPVTNVARNALTLLLIILKLR